MRFLSAVLFVALTGSLGLAADAPAAASDAKSADVQQDSASAPSSSATASTRKRVPLRVVRMLPESHQVLLFDRTKGTHVVAEVGQDVEGYLVDDIDDDEVTLVSPSGAEVILTAPDLAWRRRQADRKAADAKKLAVTGKAASAPEDPYADPADATASAAPADPYGDATASASGPAAPVVAGADGTRVASAAGATSTTADAAPSDPYADPAVAAFFEAVGSGSSSQAPATAPTTSAATPTTAAPSHSASDGAALGAALTGSPAPKSAPSASPTASAAGPTTATIKRGDIDAALGDFAGTASTFKATFTAQGLRLDDVVAGTLLAKVGLAKGDTITTVDGQPLRSLDDAANLYARLPTAKGSTLQVQRAGKPVTLRIAIQ